MLREAIYYKYQPKGFNYSFTNIILLVKKNMDIHFYLFPAGN